MLSLLKDFWVAVRNTFPGAWGQAPRRSRLMHGVGITSMGYLMDAIVDRYAHLRAPSVEGLRVRPIRDCRSLSLD